MAKWHGRIGFITTEHISDRGGLHVEKAIEKLYFGDSLKISVNFNQGNTVNTTPIIANTLSIIADSYALNNVHIMRYVEYCGVFWEIKSIEVQAPRLLLTMGGVWNGETVETSMS